MAKRKAAEAAVVDSSRPNAALIREILDRYSYTCDAWRPIQDERDIDMRYIAGDPWEEEDRRERDEAGRPCINHDELGQYVNACVNNARQNKKGIKIDPGGAGASQKTAELRQGIVRRIEYKSTASSIYVTCFQGMVEGSYSFFKIARRYESDDSFDQEIVVKPIPNPDSILFDPDVKEPDWSDAGYAYELDPMPRKEFERKFPKSDLRSFGSAELKQASKWITDREVLLANYWKVVKTSGMIYQLQDGSIVREDQLTDKMDPIRERKVERKSIVQYVTNGVEILETNKQPGEIIPIIPVIGLQRYLKRNGVMTRVLFSLVRLARDPQMSLAYLNSLEMEEAGLTPKTPYVGYKGQFESDNETWEELTKVPHAYVEADPIIDKGSNTVLPLPRREPFAPNFVAYEAAKESCRRAIQAAMGISPLPTAAQRTNQKSGVALQKIDQQEQIGSFHFVDNYERAIMLAGRVINSWIPVVYDGTRSIALSKPDDSAKIVTLNTLAPYKNEKGEDEHYPVDDSAHDVTISDAPSFASEQEAAQDFLDGLVANLHQLPIPPGSQAKLLSIAIRMKQLGPKGDEMADIISPPDDNNMSPQAQAQLAQAHGLITKLSAAVQQLSQKLEAKLPELASKERIAAGNNRADIIAALVKTQSAEAMNLLDVELAQIDRMLATIPDPGAQTTTGADGQASPAAAPAGPQPVGQPGIHIVPNPGAGAPPAPPDSNAGQ